MRHLIPVLLISSIAGCAAPKIETRFIVPEVPNETLVPCWISDRKVETVNELAILAEEHLNSAVCANSKLEAINTILTDAEASLP